MLSPNVRILLIAVLLIAVVGAAGLMSTRSTGSIQMEPNAAQAQAYLRVQVGSEVWPLIPLENGGEHVIEQENGRRNVIHTTETGMVMHFSTCDNQNCVDQGEVTLDNRESRALGSLIVCLPNEIVLELLAPEEAQVQEGTK